MNKHVTVHPPLSGSALWALFLELEYIFTVSFLFLSDLFSFVISGMQFQVSLFGVQSVLLHIKQNINNSLLIYNFKFISIVITLWTLSNCPLLFPSSILDIFWPRWGTSSSVLSFCLFILPIGFSRKEYWSGLSFSSPADHIFSNSSLWPIHFGWPCTAWLIVSLSYASPFAMTRLWYMKGILYAENIIWNVPLDKSQAGIKVAWRNINNLRYADDPTLKAESEEELKSLLMRVKERRVKQLTWNSAFKKLRSWHQVPLLHGK